MEAILVKVFATALALSLVMTRPDAVKTQFDPATDKAEVMAVLGAGCDAMRKSFDIENIDLDGLIDTVMIDKQAAAGDVAGFKGIKFEDLHLAYKQLCKHEKIPREVVDVDQVIEFYNRAAADLPDHNRLKGLQAARHDHGAGRHRREIRRAVRARQPPALGAARRDSGVRAEGVRRGRGQALLRAQGRRRAQRHARLHEHASAATSARAARPSRSRWRRTCWSATASPSSARSAR